LADDALELGRAVLKCARECGLEAAPRMHPVIERAMLAAANKSDGRRPAWNTLAERMAASFQQFLAQKHLMVRPIGPRAFFEQMWDDDRKWPWDEKLLRTRRRL
jgi:hypothetical protein